MDIGEKIKNLIKETLEVTEKRRKYFKKYFDFFGGSQWYADELRENEAESVPALVFNASEEYVEEYIARLFPRNQKTGVMEIGVKVYETNKKLRTKYEKEILNQYRENEFMEVLLEQGQNFLVGGAACLYFPADGFGGVHIYSFDPRNVFLGWENRKLKWFAYKDEEAQKIIFVSREIFAKLDYEYNLSGEPEKNESGVIPFSWIPATPFPHSREGRTKIESLFDIDREVNFRMSDFSHRVDENTIPHRVISSDSVDKKAVKRGKSKTTFLSQGDSMKNLELAEGNEILTYVSMLNARLRRKIGSVDVNSNIKTAMSGLSLSYQFAGLLDKVGFMRIQWDRAFRDLNRAILTVAMGEEGSKNYDSDPVYHPAIVHDSKARTDEYQAMLDMGVISRRDAIDELRGVENADEKLKEIDAEAPKKNIEKKVNNLNNNNGPERPQRPQAPKG